MTPSRDRTVEIAEMFRLMGDATRLTILIHCLDAPVPVGELARLTGASPSLEPSDSAQTSLLIDSESSPSFSPFVSQML